MEQGSSRARQRGPMRCRVTAVQPVTPRMLRVSVHGDALVGAVDAGPDQRVKLVFPQGRAFADDEEVARARRRRRTYTLLNLDPVAGTADVDFVLHGTGVAAEWAARVRVGDELAMTTPVGRLVLDETCRHVLLIADETGVPALRAILAGLPAGRRVSAHVEVADAAERQELPSAADVDVTWHERDATGARPGALLEALAATITCDADTTAWIAGETTAVRLLRTALLTRVGLERSRVEAVAYWQHGRVEGRVSGRP